MEEKEDLILHIHSLIKYFIWVAETVSLFFLNLVDIGQGSHSLSTSGDYVFFLVFQYYSILNRMIIFYLKYLDNYFISTENRIKFITYKLFVYSIMILFVMKEYENHVNGNIITIMLTVFYILYLSSANNNVKNESIILYFTGRIIFIFNILILVLDSPKFLETIEKSLIKTRHEL